MKTVIIGGGIAGLSLAWHLLLKKNQHVVLIEAGAVGSKATTKAAGMVTPSSEAHLGEEVLLDTFRKATTYYPEFVASITNGNPHLCDFQFNGSLLCAVDQDGERELKRLHEFQTSMGIESRDISRDEALELGPALSHRIVRSFYSRHEGHLDPFKLVDVLKRACLDKGLVLYENTTLAGTVSSGQNLTQVHVCETRKKDLFTATGKNLVIGIDTLGINGDAFVLCTGLSHGVAQLDALVPLPLRAVKGQVVTIQGEPGMLSVPVRIHHRYPIYLVPRQNGEIVIGATSEELSTETMTAGGMMDLIYGAWQILPGLYDAPIISSWAGLRPALPDHKPAIGRAARDNLFVCTGLYRHGIMLGPYIGQELAAYLCGEQSQLSWKEFDPGRFKSEARHAS